MIDIKELRQKAEDAAINWDDVTITMPEYKRQRDYFEYVPPTLMLELLDRLEMAERLHKTTSAANTGLCAELEEAEARNKKLREALKFYGFEAIHNPLSADKTEQYWTEEGIWDHGEIARKALGDK